MDIKGNYLVTSGWDGIVKVWDMITGNSKTDFKLEFYVNCILWHGNYIYAGGKDGRLVKLEFNNSNNNQRLLNADPRFNN